MEVKIKKLNENAVIPFKKYDDDFCYDCIAISEEEIAPNVWKYGLGLAFEIDKSSSNLIGVADDWGSSRCFLNNFSVKFSIDIRSRSSIWEHGMILANSVGTVDDPFRGEVSAIFYHVMPNMPRYKIGEKVCQIKLGVTLPIDFKVVNELSTTKRGEGGFGHTGK